MLPAVAEVVEVGERRARGRCDVGKPRLPLSLLRERITRAKREAEKRQGRHDWWAWPARADHSELVRIFLWEGDALAIYQRQLEPTLAGANPDAYREAVGLLRKVRALLARLGRKAEFPRYLDSVRAAHKRKRNFLRLLDRARWA